MPLFRASSLFLPVLLLTGLALASAIVIAATAACIPIHAAGEGLHAADAGRWDRLESGEPLESASPDLHGDRGGCDRPDPLAEALRIDRPLPRPFSNAGDRPRARLPDRAVGPYPAPGSSRPLKTFRSDRLPPARLEAAQGRLA